MNREFTTIAFDPDRFLSQDLPRIPSASGIYRIVDLSGKTILLDGTHHLRERLNRYFGERVEPIRDLDLRQVAGHIEFLRTFSPFETLYVLLHERRRHFPDEYRAMQTVREVRILKINRKQRFPRLYSADRLKPGVDFFGPFVSRQQMDRLKTSVERTFRLRPCLYNIRGNDPHPDCLYFQTRGCSRPCNGDIDRSAYARDVNDAIAFIRGDDDTLRSAGLRKIEELSAQLDYEAAGRAKHQLDRIVRARQDQRETFRSLDQFNFIVVTAGPDASTRLVALVREGLVVWIEPVGWPLPETPPDAVRFAWSSFAVTDRSLQYDEFCLVSQFLIDPVQSVTLIPALSLDDAWSSARPAQPRKPQRRKSKPDADSES